MSKALNSKMIRRCCIHNTIGKTMGPQITMVTQLMPQSHLTIGPVRFLSPVRFLARKAEWSARRNFTAWYDHGAVPVVISGYGLVRLDTAAYLWHGWIIRRTPRIPRAMPVRASYGPRTGIFNVCHILLDPCVIRVTIRLVMLGNQSSGWLPKCSCEGNVCTEVGTRFNVYEISVSFPHVWKSQQVTLGVKCDARWVIGHVCVNKGPRRSCVLYICTVFPGLGILVDMSRSSKGPSLQRQMNKRLN